ncbi:hypothetical protein AAE478_006882 [Parahypoxylon ruwenzoriense]
MDNQDTAFNPPQPADQPDNTQGGSVNINQTEANASATVGSEFNSQAVDNEQTNANSQSEANASTSTTFEQAPNSESAANVAGSTSSRQATGEQSAANNQAVDNGQTEVNDQWRAKDKFEANASTSASLDTVTNSSPTEEVSACITVNLQNPTAGLGPSTSIISSYPSSDSSFPPSSRFTHRYSMTANASASVTFSSSMPSRSINTPGATATVHARARSVSFNNMTAVRLPNGTVTQEPINIPLSSASATTNMEPTQTQNQQQSQPAAAAAPAAAQPPPVPPQNPPPPVAAAPESGDPNNDDSDPAPSPDPIPARPAPPTIAPPVGARERAAAQQRFLVMGGLPGQNVVFQNPSNAPFLLVNPPLVAPSVAPPPPGNTGSWCYPSQSPFFTGTSHLLTNPPSQAPAPPVYVTEPVYVVNGAPQPQRQTQPQQVHYYVNGTTGPFLYYM